MTLFQALILSSGLLIAILLSLILDKLHNYLVRKKNNILTFDEYLIKNALYLQKEVIDNNFSNFHYYFKETLLLQKYKDYLLACGVSELKLSATGFNKIMFRSKETFDLKNQYKVPLTDYSNEITYGISDEIESLVKKARW